MKIYDRRLKRPSGKTEKSFTTKIRHRWFGSTHASATKKRIERLGKRAARQEAKKEVARETDRVGS